MSILPSLIKRSKYGPSDDYWYRRVIAPTKAGVNVDEKAAMNYLTVWACVTLIAGDVARLPLNLYRRRKNGGKDTVTDHSTYDVMHNAANNETTAFHYREAAVGHNLLWGNTYSWKEYDKQGNLIGLWLIPEPGGVEVFRVGQKQLDKLSISSLRYRYKNADGKEVTKGRDEIFHVPGYGFNGLYGLSMISVAREAIGMGLAAEQYGSTFFGEGTHPGGLLTLPPEVQLGDAEAEYVKAIKEQYAGLGKSHSVMLLKNGEEYKSLSMPMEDAQFLQTRDHQKIEICGMYHVPPHKIAIHGQNSNYNNLEQENASYVDSCLMHWLVRWESCISQQLLTIEERRSGLFFEFLVSGLLRGDSTARADYYNKMFQVGGITPNEIRSKENMNPHDDNEEADEAFVMLNMVPLKDAGMDLPEPQGQFTPGAQAPGLENEPEPEPGTEEKASFKRFFLDRPTEKRSIVVRDRIAKRYAPLIRDAATAIVNREVQAIKRKVTSRATEADIVHDFLNEFYEKFPDYIRKKMGPVLRSFMIAIADEAYREINVDDIDVSNEIKLYIDGYADRHVRSSLGQMLVLLEGELADLDQRADEWLEKRPDKIVTDESVRASNAAYVFVGAAAGLSSVWRIRGPKTCPYCQELNGRRVASGSAFVDADSTVEPGGDAEPMKVWGMKTHPPLHRGCDCYISFGGARSSRQLPRHRNMSPQNWKDVYAEGGAHWANDLQPSKLAQDFAEKIIKIDGHGNKLVEIGCAVGKDSILFALAGMDVTGIDITPEAIRLAKKNAKTAEVNITFKVGDAEVLEYEDNSFDYYFSLSVLHSTDLKKSISEARRVLVEDGIAFIHLYSDTQKIDGDVEIHVSVDDFISLVKAKGFNVDDFYTQQEDDYDEAGEKHLVIVATLSGR